MGVAYKKLIDINLKHDFYTDGFTRDFSVYPTQATADILRNNNLLFRNTPTGITVLYRVVPGETTPFIDFSDLTLKFIMRLKNLAGFENITNLNDTQDYTTGCKIAFENNTTTQTELDYSIINALKPGVFDYTFPQEAAAPSDEGAIEILDSDGNNVTPTNPDPNDVSPNSNDQFVYPIDFSKMKPGLYTFNTTVNGSGDEEEKIYIDSALVKQEVFGIMTIHIPDAESSSYPVDRLYNASFTRRSPIWRYMMVLASGFVDIDDTIEVKDDSETYGFTQQSDTTLNGIDVAVFDSDTAIPLQQAPITTFQFLKDISGSMTVVANHLSNPNNELISADGTDFSKTEIYVYV